MVTDNESRVLGTADRVEVYLEQDTGDLDLDGGADKLMEATFRYNIEQWKPVVTYKEQGEVWNLSVIQPGTDMRVASGAENNWDIELGSHIPIDLAINLGAGDADLVLGYLDLTDLDVNVGAGDLFLDLASYDGDNLTVHLNCGVGEADLRVPGGMGVRVVPILGVGSVSSTGLTLVGSEYHNGAYDPQLAHVVIYANLGVGDLNVVEV